jgi:hypothetical protein
MFGGHFQALAPLLFQLGTHFVSPIADRNPTHCVCPPKFISGKSLNFTTDFEKT